MSPARPVDPLDDELNRELVRLISHGHTVQGAALRVHLSDTAAWKRLARLRRRLMARNTAHVVAQAIRRGWIE